MVYYGPCHKKRPARTLECRSPAGPHTPKPRLIELEMVPAGNLRLLSGELALQATRYALKPKLGAALRLVATLLGKAPPADQECVILTEDIPAFVRCDGPLYLKGPVWRIEGTSAR